tara:strand:- start:416 stop:1426 length:1011 start_codon:yes stop_codon:yes gene_type:complete
MLNVGIIGLGVGEKHIDGYKKNKYCDVSFICDFDKEKLNDVSNRNKSINTTSNPKDILTSEKIDIVSIASYDNFHAEQVILALDNNKHVFVEKPLCLNQFEFENILEALNRNPHLSLSSNLILRCTPRFKNLRKSIQNSELGTPYYVEASYDYGRINKIINGWRGKLDFYSVMHGGGIHLIDLMTWLMDDQIVSVFAAGTKIATQNTDFKYSDCVTATLKFKGNAIGNITANFPSVIAHGHRLGIYGTKKTFHHGPFGAGFFADRDPASLPETINDPYPGASKGDLIPSFVDHILDPLKTPLVSKREVLQAMAVSLAIEDSLKTNMPKVIDYKKII